MYKKFLVVAFALMLVLGMTACNSGNDSEAVNNFDAEIDVEYAKDVVQTISSFGDDPVMGMRSAGSPAEKQTNDTSAFDGMFEDAYTAAAALEEKMADVEAGDDKDAAVELNKQTQEIYKILQDYWVGLDFINVDAVIRHELYQNNIENLDEAIAALEKGDVAEAYDEYLWAIDWAWYDMYFDKETTSYMKNQLFENRQGTWGDGLIEFPHADIWDVVQSLGEKYEAENPDVTSEIAALKEIRGQQQDYLDKVYVAEKEGLEKAIDLMNKYAK